MTSRRGIIALMGSGELTSTMVEVHKELLRGLGGNPQAVFLDTPAGFQLNADELAERAAHYFRKHVGHPLHTVSFKSKATAEPHERERVYRSLREADYILIGPGSPTYAVKQWMGTPIPEIFHRRLQEGACLVAASAAALTLGCRTLPVYEIYKVGEPPHWVEGLDLLGRFGFHMVVVPHWNNAEGGTHDTRFCYMGEPRFRELERQLDAGVTILGLDEHTACLMDLETRRAEVRGIGRVTVRSGGREIRLDSGEAFYLDLLSGVRGAEPWKPVARVSTQLLEAPSGADEGSFWDQVRAMEARFDDGAERGDARRMVAVILDMDRLLWQAQSDREYPELISQGRERYRDLMVRFGVLVERLPRSRVECLSPVVEALLELRETYRSEKRWSEADRIRDALNRGGVRVEDTPEGPRWELNESASAGVRGPV